MRWKLGLCCVCCCDVRAGVADAWDVRADDVDVRAGVATSSSSDMRLVLPRDEAAVLPTDNVEEDDAFAYMLTEGCIACFGFAGVAGAALAEGRDARRGLLPRQAEDIVLRCVRLLV